MIRDRAGWSRLGFYRHDWALSPLLYLEEEAPVIQGAQAHRVRGLLFGYDASAIERFISSASDALVAGGTLDCPVDLTDQQIVEPKTLRYICKRLDINPADFGLVLD